MDTAIVVTVVAISLALPVAMIGASSAFVWYGARQFAPGTRFASIARFLALVVIICSVAWALYFTFTVYRPLLHRGSGEGLDALIIVFGPALLSSYAAAAAFIIGIALWLASILWAKRAS
jgi:hypothetical protein